MFVFLTEDKEVLTGILEGSKETIDGKIGDKETEIFRVIQDDWKNTSLRIHDQQHTRNRNIIEETIKTCENFREDISKAIISD